jgi:hypothetical protein
MQPNRWSDDETDDRPTQLKESPKRGLSLRLVPRNLFPTRDHFRVSQGSIAFKPLREFFKIDVVLDDAIAGSYEVPTKLGLLRGPSDPQGPALSL